MDFDTRLRALKACPPVALLPEKGRQQGYRGPRASCLKGTSSMESQELEEQHGKATVKKASFTFLQAKNKSSDMNRLTFLRAKTAKAQ